MSYVNCFLFFNVISNSYVKRKDCCISLVHILHATLDPSYTNVCVWRDGERKTYLCKKRDSFSVIFY